MKSIAIAFALLQLATLGYSAPGSAKIQARQSQAVITFLGAGPNPPTYTQGFPLDCRSHAITNTLSVSHIRGAAGADCTFHGIDGSVTTTDGNETVDVGPPQVQVSGTCCAA